MRNRIAVACIVTAITLASIGTMLINQAKPSMWYSVLFLLGALLGIVAVLLVDFND